MLELGSEHNRHSCGDAIAMHFIAKVLHLLHCTELDCNCSTLHLIIPLFPVFDSIVCLVTEDVINGILQHFTAFDGIVLQGAKGSQACSSKIEKHMDHLYTHPLMCTSRSVFF